MFICFQRSLYLQKKSSFSSDELHFNDSHNDRAPSPIWFTVNVCKSKLVSIMYHSLFYVNSQG